MSLARNWRLYAVNNTGRTLAVTGADALTITYRGVKADGSHQTAQQTLSYTTPDLTNGSPAYFSAVDNSTDQFVGLDGTLTVAATDVAANGTIDIRMETSTDGGTTWPSSSPDFVPSQGGMWVTSLRIVSDGAGYETATNIKI